MKFIKNKKGLSQVVGTVVMVLITIGLIAGIWGFINTFVEDKLESAAACKDVFDKVSFNDIYTCYNVTSNSTLVSIKVGELEIDGLLLAVSFGTDNKIFFLENKTKTFDNFTMYDGNASVYMPRQESTRTYLLNIATKPEKVEVAPKMGDKQCGIVDIIENIPTCL